MPWKKKIRLPSTRRRFRAPPRRGNKKQRRPPQCASPGVSNATGSPCSPANQKAASLHPGVSSCSYQTINLLVDQELVSLLHSRRPARLSVTLWGGAGGVCRVQALKQIAELSKRDGAFLVDVYAVIKRTVQISPWLRNVPVDYRTRKIVLFIWKLSLIKKPSRTNKKPLCVCRKQVRFVKPYFQSQISHCIISRTPTQKTKCFLQ